MEGPAMQNAVSQTCPLSSVYHRESYDGNGDKSQLTGIHVSMESLYSNVDIYATLCHVYMGKFLSLA